MSIDEHTSKKISLLSLIAAILVVSIHAPVTRQSGSSMFFETFLSTYVASVAVPFFFVVSGYLLAMKLGTTGGYSIELRKRFRSLLLPYLFWCVAFTLLASLNSFAHNIILHDALMQNINVNPIKRFGLDLRSNPPLPLWYLRALMIYVLISPLFRLIVKRRTLTALVLLGLIAFDYTCRFFMPEWAGNMLTFDLAPCNLGAFLIGMHLSYYPVSISSKLGGPSLLLGLALCAILAAVKCEYFSLDSYYRTFLAWLAKLLVIIGAWQLCPPIELPNFLRRQSFPIYLLHAVFVPYALMAAQKFPALQEWWGFLINICILTILSIATCHLLRTMAPKFSAYIFGGR